MPISFFSRAGPFDSDPDTDSEDAYYDENSVRFQPVREPAGSEDGEHSDYFMCEKCDVRFLNAEALHRHMRQGNGEDGERKHFYCGKCRVNCKDERELEKHKMESSEHVVCRECSREFGVDRELELHWDRFHKPQPEATHPCPGCDSMFTSISGVTQHIESGQCEGSLSAEEFRELINYENNPLAKRDLPEHLLAGSTTTHAWRAGILPQRVRNALAKAPDGFKPEELAPKDFVGVLDYTLPAKQDSLPVENLNACWNKMVGAYVCPRPKCGKKFARTPALKAHLESNTHDKKSFRCPTCRDCFVSSSALIQHAESEACGVKRSPAYQQLIKGATGGLIGGDKKVEYQTGW